MKVAGAILATAIAFLLGWHLGRLERATPELPLDWLDEYDNAEPATLRLSIADPRAIRVDDRMLDGTPVHYSRPADG